MKVITVKTLKKHYEKPCANQLRKFKKLFPKGAKLTLKNLKLAVESNLDIAWAAYTLLSVAAYEEYETHIKDEWNKLPLKCNGEDRMKYKAFRNYLHFTIPHLWEAIKLDRKEGK